MTYQSDAVNGLDPAAHWEHLLQRGQAGLQLCGHLLQQVCVTKGQSWTGYLASLRTPPAPLLLRDRFGALGGGASLLGCDRLVGRLF